MKKSDFLTSIVAALALTAGTANAADTMNGGMEKCTITDANGKGLIKAHMADCKSITSSCAGQNEAGDPNAWILVPKGQCAMINAGDFSSVSQSIQDKIDMTGAND